MNADARAQMNAVNTKASHLDIESGPHALQGAARPDWPDGLAARHTAEDRIRCDASDCTCDVAARRVILGWGVVAGGGGPCTQHWAAARFDRYCMGVSGHAEG